MMRAALVLAMASLAVVAVEPAASDPSFTVPPPSTAAPESSAPQKSAPPASPPDSTIQPPAAAPVSPPASVPEPAKPPAAAATTEEGAARYSFHRIEDSFIRLDTRTGHVSKCGWAATGWSCQAAADERAALDNEIARLQRENAELKRSLLAHGVDLPAGPVAEAPSAVPSQPAPSQAAPVPPAPVPDPTPSKEPKGPNEVDVNRAIAFVKHVWQRLVDLMVDLQRDIQRRS